ncbi:hypothetical protein MANES_15G079200v8 [Manihot esculenta]|uniref:RRM domain-containing protein n=1 Tax=Manihot esculenta TaxID=3983 RepID=A0A2C9UE68_MANES|nr:hypothetical protein MANES_15G079200v8 [Manihot esculenta]
MAMRARASLAAAPSGFLRLFSTTSTSSFIPSPTTAETSAQEKAEPNTNLFVCGLSKRTTSEGLREAFSKFARVVTDRVSGYSKGFGFVGYAGLDDAAKGIESMDGKFLDGWVIFTEYARPRSSPTPPGNNVGPGYGSNTGPAYGSSTGRAFGNATGPAYGSSTGREYGARPAYQSNMGPEYGNARSIAYGNTTYTAHVSNVGPNGNSSGPA